MVATSTDTSLATRYRRVLSDPSGKRGLSLSDRLASYLLYWGYYSNNLYQEWELELNDPHSAWQQYRALYDIYRFIRALYNPAKRLVDFYVGEIYPPPALVSDGITVVDDIPLAFPLNAKTKPAIQKAIAQGHQWANWLVNNDLFVTYTAALGNCLVEIVDDRARRKVYPRVYWPGHVTDIELDSTGNVVFYELTIPATDEEGNTYTYMKRVDKQFIKTYKNTELFDYTGVQAETIGGEPGVVPNPYGFVPAKWKKFNDTGEEFGQPVFWTLLPKIDELNGLVSMVHDRLAILLTSDLFAKGDTDLSALDADADDAALSGPTPDSKDKEKVGIVEVDRDFALEALPIDVSQAQPFIEALYEDLMRDARELKVYNDDSQAPESGYALSLRLGDVEGQVYKHQHRFDEMQIDIWQMTLTMGGFLLHSGAWGQPNEWTEQQKLFEPFNLDSYANNQVSFSIPTRKFLAPTDQQKWTARGTRATALAAEEALGKPKEDVLAELDIPADKIKAIIEEQAAAEVAANEQRAKELQMLADAQYGTNGVGNTEGENVRGDDDDTPVIE